MNTHIALGIAGVLGALAGYVLSGDRDAELKAAGLQRAHGAQFTLVSGAAEPKPFSFIQPSEAGRD